MLVLSLSCPSNATSRQSSFPGFNSIISRNTFWVTGRSRQTSNCPPLTDQTTTAPISILSIWLESGRPLLMISSYRMSCWSRKRSMLSAYSLSWSDRASGVLGVCEASQTLKLDESSLKIESPALVAPENLAGLLFLYSALLLHAALAHG